jgi:hypothetical protein
VAGHGSGGALRVADGAVDVTELLLKELARAQVNERLLLTRQQLDALVGRDLLVGHRQVRHLVVPNRRSMQAVPGLRRHLSFGERVDEQLQHRGRIIEPLFQRLGDLVQLEGQHAHRPAFGLGLHCFGLRGYGRHCLSKAGREA